jgi:hypothetical protein
MYSGLKVDELICLGLIINSNALNFKNLSLNFSPTKKIIGVQYYRVQSNPYCSKLVFWLAFAFNFNVQ